MAPDETFLSGVVFLWNKIFNMKSIIITSLIVFTLNTNLFSQELLIGEERIEPGIVIIFEGAIKDHIVPLSMHLSENQTNIHIEARVNWDIKNIPQGAPIGGFIPYLYINAKVVNQTNGLSTFIDLLPHINLIDNFHYARNIALPGSVDDLYSVEFNIIAPAHTELALHRDWIEQYGSFLNEEFKFSYKNINFEIIARAKRR